MRNLSIKQKFFGVFCLLFLVISVSGMFILYSLSKAQKDVEILNVLGRQRVLAQEMAKSVFGYSIAKSQEKTLEQQIQSLDHYITQMRKTYTESVIQKAQKLGMAISMTPSSEPHPAIPFPATFTRMVNEKFDHNKGFSVDIISENPINPNQILKSELDKEANIFLQKSPDETFTKIFKENDKLYIGLYSSDKATTPACASCHSALQNKKINLGDTLGIRNYKLVYSENIALGITELNANLNEYITSKTMFEFTLLVMKLGGEYPLDAKFSNWKKIRPLQGAKIQKKISAIEKQFHGLVQIVEGLLSLKTNSVPYRKARQNISTQSNTLKTLSDELLALFTVVAKRNHRNIKFAVITAGTTTLFMLISLAYYITRIIVKPIQQMSKVLTETVKGNLKQKKLTVYTEDEIGVLRQSYNKLVVVLQCFIHYSEDIYIDKLNVEQFDVEGDFETSLKKLRAIAKAKINAENELRKSQINLESRVKERTSELLKSNESLLQEITLRVKLDEALHASEIKMKTVLDNLIDGVITIDEDGIILSYNQGAQNIFGYDEAEALGQNIKFLMPEPYTSEHDQYIKNYINTGVTKIIGIGREVLGLRKNGTTFPFDLGISEIYQGEERFFTGVVRDLSEQKLLQAQLNHAQKMESIGQLAAGIAHEINTPMQFVGDNTMFLQRSFSRIFDTVKAHDRLLTECKKGAVSEKMVEEMEASCQNNKIDYLSEEIPLAIKQSLEGVKRVSTIVKAMKEFSHPGSEEKISIDINQAIGITLTVAKNEWKYVAEIVTNFDPNLPLVPCFANDFNQVILNTVVNAAHAIGDVVKNTGNKGTITLSTSQDGDWAEIRIKDTGTGIPENIRSKIYDPFFTTKEVGKGTGQGLSIVHSIIVKKHQGAVSLESKEGKGTTFIFRLPLDTHK